MRTALVLNPGAGASMLANQKIHEQNIKTVLLHKLRKQGLEPEIYYTTPEDPGQGIAAYLAQEHVKLVIVAGGDGTIHAVAHGLIGSASVLGILPLGTMNNLARSLGIPEDLDAACAILTDGEVRDIDVGKINQHMFLEVAGVGLEAALFPAAEAVKEGGPLSTVKGVLKGLYTLFRFKPPHISLAFDNEEPHTYRAIQVTVCNTPYYGSHLKVAPQSYMNDGWLNVVLYTNFSKREYIQHAISISQGRRVFTPKIIHRRIKTLRINTATAVELQADGTAHGSTPAQITIIPAALKVQSPREPGPGLLPEEGKQKKRKPAERKKMYV